MKIAAKILVLGIAVLLLWYSKKEYEATIAELEFLHLLQNTKNDDDYFFSKSHHFMHVMRDHPFNDTIRSIKDLYYKTIKEIDSTALYPDSLSYSDIPLLKKSFRVNNQKLALRKETNLKLENYNHLLKKEESRRLLELVRPTIHMANNHQKDSIKVLIRLVETFDSIRLPHNSLYYNVGNKKIYDFSPCISSKEIEGISVNKIYHNGYISRTESKWY